MEKTMNTPTIHSEKLIEKVPQYLKTTIENDNNLENQVESIKKLLDILQKLIRDTNKDYIVYSDTKNKESPIDWNNSPVDVWLSVIKNLPLINYAYQKTIKDYGLSIDNYMTDNINDIQQAGTPLNTAYHILHWKLTSMKMKNIEL